MFGAIGIPEVVVVLILCVIWVIPIAAAIWALVTLQQIRTSQKAIQAAIDQLLQRR